MPPVNFVVEHLMKSWWLMTQSNASTVYGNNYAALVTRFAGNPPFLRRQELSVIFKVSDARTVFNLEHVGEK